MWQPALPTSDWRFLGQVVQGNYDKCAQRLFRFRSDPRSSTADMVRPEGFVWIWDDRLSYASKDVSVWRMTCPQGEARDEKRTHSNDRLNTIRGGSRNYKGGRGAFVQFIFVTSCCFFLVFFQSHFQHTVRSCSGCFFVFFTITCSFTLENLNFGQNKGAPPAHPFPKSALARPRP